MRKYMDLTKRIKNTLTNIEIIEIYKEVNRYQKLIDIKYRELIAVQLINYLKTKSNELNIQIAIERESHSPFFQVYVYDENGDDDLDETSRIQDLINLSSSIIRSIEEEQQSIEFHNNEIGRDEILRMFIGKKWQEWKKEGEITENYNHLLNEISEKPSTTNKIKI